jgi:energy-coupling factor transporter ATP-binding protein EcfA2
MVAAAVPQSVLRADTMSGMRVAIVGGPGVGKSTLVRQLADLYHHGSYGEGEKGVWDPRVLSDIEAGRNPVGVTAYFGHVYDANYRDAAEHDRPDRVIFFEGARITLEAHVAEYPPSVTTRCERCWRSGTPGSRIGRSC